MQIFNFIIFFTIIFHLGAQTEDEDVLVLDQRPIRYFHGIGGKCPEKGKFSFRVCIETGKGLFPSIRDLGLQSETGCRILENEIFDQIGNVRPLFRNGFHLEGSSQGGIIVRMIFRNCHKVRPLVRRILTYGTPNMGINRISKLEGLKKVASLFLRLIEKSNTREEMKAKYSFYQFLNTVEKVGDNEEVVYSDLIGELLKSVTYTKDGQVVTEDRIYDKLEAMVVVQFTEDEVVVPRSSATFGMTFRTADSQNPFSDFSENPIFSESGLKELWSRNRLISCAVKNTHLVYDNDGQRSEVRGFLFDNYSFVIKEGLAYNFDALYEKTFALNLNENPPTSLSCSSHLPNPYLMI